MSAVFTEEMKKTHTILLPEMLEYHFPILKAAFVCDGYKVEILDNNSSKILDYGKKYVHNDMCYPAVSIIGQMIEALKSKKYNPNLIAFMIPQAGGACRATNYYFLLKKALKSAGYPQVPVISLNLNGMNNQPGFKISIKMILAAVNSVFYGDLLMHLYQQIKPYERQNGESDGLLEKWQKILFSRISEGKIKGKKERIEIYSNILQDFAKIKLNNFCKKKIGVVGELYIKYCNLGNKDAERFLLENDCEIHTTGFAIYSLYIIQSVIDDKKSNIALKKAAAGLLRILIHRCDEINRVVSQYNNFTLLPEFNEFLNKADSILSEYCITGDGWLISAEASVLIENGFNRIVCLSPFGCLVSHTNCKGISAEIRRKYPKAFITNVDCDADSSLALYQSRLLLAIRE